MVALWPLGLTTENQTLRGRGHYSRPDKEVGCARLVCLGTSCSLSRLKRGSNSNLPWQFPQRCPPVINYAHFHAAITPHPAPQGVGNSQPGPMCFFTIMMTHHTQPIEGNDCSKDITFDPCNSQTKAPTCSGFKFLWFCEPLLFLPITPYLLPCVWFNRGKRDGER